MDARRLDRLSRALLRVGVLTAALLLASSPLELSTAAADSTPDPDDVAASAALERLSTIDRAGQLVMTSIPGTRLDARATAQLRRLRPGGVIVFADNVASDAQLRRLLRTMQVAARTGDPARPQALVSVDQEGGVVKRLPAAPPRLSHPQLGGRDRVELTRSQGRATGLALRGVGIRMDLAPVADLDAGPRRVMRARSFGRSPSLVARHVAAFVDGLEGAGVAASVKHFPGFGGASVNSDDALATVGRTRTQLSADLQPFRRAVGRDVDSIMVSHGVYRWIDRRRPASASPAVYRILRSQLGFDGVAITDSLHAAGFGAALRTSVPAGCVRAVAAGADIALLTGSLVDALRCRAQLVAAVRDGRLDSSRLDEAATRVLRLKSSLGLLGVSPQPAPAG